MQITVTCPAKKDLDQIHFFLVIVMPWVDFDQKFSVEMKTYQNSNSWKEVDMHLNCGEGASNFMNIFIFQDKFCGYELPLNHGQEIKDLF